jgi:DNA-binding NarL/FixJ family response regulator
VSSTSISSHRRDRRAEPPGSRDGPEATRRGELDLLLVDDHFAARYNVWALLRWKRDIRIIDLADSSVEAIALATRRRPQVCLISATLGQGEALTLAFRMKRLMHPPRVLIFADAIDAQLAGAAIVAAADGVLWRYADPEQHVGVIRRAATGAQQFPTLRSNDVLALLDGVEDRDRAIVAMLLQRIAPDDIARTLGISARALQRRHTSILTGLGDTRGDDIGRKAERKSNEPVNGDQGSPLVAAISPELVSIG